MARRLKDRILVVEDNDHLRVSISEFLTLNGYLANDAENGKTALDQLEQNPTPPALILLDLHMPVMDGMTFLQRLKASPRLRSIPVLLMTAQSSPPPLEVAAILLKPFAPKSLLSLVKQWATVKQRKYKPRRGVAVRGART
jgi:CheY-like chemotaxis protein